MDNDNDQTQIIFRQAHELARSLDHVNPKPTPPKRKRKLYANRVVDSSDIPLILTDHRAPENEEDLQKEDDDILNSTWLYDPDLNPSTTSSTPIDQEDVIHIHTSTVLPFILQTSEQDSKEQAHLKESRQQLHEKHRYDYWKYMWSSIIFGFLAAGFWIAWIVYAWTHNHGPLPPFTNIRSNDQVATIDWRSHGLGLDNMTLSQSNNTILMKDYIEQLLPDYHYTFRWKILLNTGRIWYGQTEFWKALSPETPAQFNYEAYTNWGHVYIREHYDSYQGLWTALTWEGQITDVWAETNPDRYPVDNWALWFFQFPDAIATLREAYQTPSLCQQDRSLWIHTQYMPILMCLNNQNVPYQIYGEGWQALLSDWIDQGDQVIIPVLPPPTLTNTLPLSSLPLCTNGLPIHVWWGCAKPPVSPVSSAAPVWTRVQTTFSRIQPLLEFHVPRMLSYVSSMNEDGIQNTARIRIPFDLTNSAICLFIPDAGHHSHPQFPHQNELIHISRGNMVHESFGWATEIMTLSTADYQLELAQIACRWYTYRTLSSDDTWPTRCGPSQSGYFQAVWPTIAPNNTFSIPVSLCPQYEPCSASTVLPVYGCSDGYFFDLDTATLPWNRTDYLGALCKQANRVLFPSISNPGVIFAHGLGGLALAEAVRQTELGLLVGIQACQPYVKWYSLGTPWLGSVVLDAWDDLCQVSTASPWLDDLLQPVLPRWATETCWNQTSSLQPRPFSGDPFWLDATWRQLIKDRVLGSLCGTYFIGLHSQGGYWLQSFWTSLANTASVHDGLVTIESCSAAMNLSLDFWSQNPTSRYALSPISHVELSGIGGDSNIHESSQLPLAWMMERIHDVFLTG